MTRCSGCNDKLEGNEVFCPYCGQKQEKKEKSNDYTKAEASGEKTSSPVKVRLKKEPGQAEFSFPRIFPDICTYCGQPKETEETLVLNGSYTGKNEQKESFNVSINLPYCREHLNINRRNEKASTIILIISILVGITGAIFMHLNYSPAFGVTEGPFLVIFWLLAICGAAYLPYILLMSFLSFMTGLIMKIKYGHPFQQTLGVLAYVPPDSRRVELVFDNSDFKQKFIELNRANSQQE